MLIDKFQDAPLLKLVSALNAIGTNDNEARRTIEELGLQGPLGGLIKKVRDLIDIDEDERDVHTPSSSPYHKEELDIHRKIDVRSIDFNLLNALVHHGIIEVRSNKGVGELKPHPILTSATLDHNNYQIKKDQLTHYQSQPHKKTVKERILSFGGNEFRRMGENVLYKGFPSRIYASKREIITVTNDQTAQTLVQNWVHSPGHYRNLISSDFRFVGTAVGWNPENVSLFATQVFGA